MSTQSYNPAGLVPAPYTDRYLEVGGLKLHVQDYGTAGKPQMLCVHGSAAHAHWFDFVASGLNDEYHVLAPDQRGHGDSEWDRSAHPEYNYDRYAADLHQLAEQLDLRDFILVGNSCTAGVRRSTDSRLACAPNPIRQVALYGGHFQTPDRA
ncbi:MAG: alpha/beta hydrolase [Steroidobacteraceae bacterium]|nr:alpha/beta hydrolase [Steroidobacteraceae bacterium]